MCYYMFIGASFAGSGAGGGHRPGGFPGLACLGGAPCRFLLPLLASFPFPPPSPGAWCCARTVPGRCGPGGPCVAVIALRPLACFCPRRRAAWPCGGPLARLSWAGRLPCGSVRVAPCGGLARWPPPRRPGLVRWCCPPTPPPPLAAPPWRALIWPWRSKAPSCFGPGVARGLYLGVVMFDLCSVFKGAGQLAVGGSRDLAGPGAFALVDLAAAWQAGGASLGVGCSIGADAIVLGCLAVPRRVSVFAACSSSGAGAWPGTALASVRAAHARGASVHWLVGGPLSLALPARLAARSRALALASSGCLVALSSRTSPGSLVLAGSVAARRGPVVALACGFPWYCLPPLVSGGHWRRLSSDGGVAAALWVAGQ